VPVLHVLRVFTNEAGEWGNRLGVFLQGSEIPAEDRLETAATLGYSETVFVDDRDAGQIRIYTPEIELPFAGHPTVGTAWLLARTGTPVAVLRPPAGDVPARVAQETAVVEALPEWSPPFAYRRLASPAEVRGLPGPPDAEASVYAWAWIDEDAGTIRARAFLPAAGIPEDEATGSAALALCARLGRPIVVHQGRGSVIAARPSGEGRVELGGNVRLDEVREHRLSER
jgi:predicted PhzF superfamily epimerase YddE/YHI9